MPDKYSVYSSRSRSRSGSWSWSRSGSWSWSGSNSLYRKTGITLPQAAVDFLQESINMEFGFDFEIGEAVFIRCINNYYTGRIKKITHDSIVLVECAAIPDTGRFHVAMETGGFDEVEMYHADQRVSINIGQIESVTNWPHTLPTKSK